MLKNNNAWVPLVVAAGALCAASCSPTTNSERAGSVEIPEVERVENIDQATTETDMKLAAGPELSELEFGPDNTLFAASNETESVYAFQLRDSNVGKAPDQPIPFNLETLGTDLSQFFDVQPLDITYNDLAVHPISTEAYLSVAVRMGTEDFPALIRIDQTGTLSIINTGELDYETIELADPANEDIVFWREIPAASLTVTDLEFSDGKLLVAGLSTGEFASTLRIIDFPFAEKVSSSSIEMFHTAHNQNETRAPIRAMTVATINGERTLIAAYTCTPLVTIPTASLQDGEHVFGKTIAELGYGNVPIEVLSISTMNMQTQQPEEFVLVINREMSANLIRMEDLAAAAAAPGITTAFKGLGDTMGVDNTRHPLSGVIQADVQDAQFILMLKRNIDSGEVELVSQMKGVYFRLSDFVSEYNFPDYEYPDGQAMTQMFHNMVKPMEGYPELVRN
ncbi:MAG: hypothetical protein AAGL90_15695 [Pseudomonadota bacterium]